jgi:hypothetical protein
LRASRFHGSSCGVGRAFRRDLLSVFASILLALLWATTGLAVVFLLALGTSVLVASSQLLAVLPILFPVAVPLLRLVPRWRRRAATTGEAASG